MIFPKILFFFLKYKDDMSIDSIFDRIFVKIRTWMMKIEKYERILMPS